MSDLGDSDDEINGADREDNITLESDDEMERSFEVQSEKSDEDELKLMLN